MEAAAIIKKIRATSGITRKELAKLADVSPSTIGRIERGEMDPTWGTMQKIFTATGYQLNGSSVVSSGDTSAIQAANALFKPILDKAYAPMTQALRTATSAQGKVFAEAARTAMGSYTGQATSAARATIADAVREPLRAATSKSVGTLLSSVKIPTSPWADRWRRTGWLGESVGVDDLVAIAVTAGNAGKVARRSGTRYPVEVEGGWRNLVDQLTKAGVDYAVSGIVATRKDRSDARAGTPLVYVDDPREAAERLGLEKARPGRGILLLEAVSGELNDVDEDAGIRFMPRSRALLDAFSGPGRDPDKAEELLRTLWEDAS